MRSDVITITTTPTLIDTGIPGSTVQFTPRGDIYMGHKNNIAASDGVGQRKIGANVPMTVYLGGSQSLVRTYLVAASGSVLVDRTIMGVNPV